MKIEDISTKNVIHCETETEANRILYLAHMRGGKWSNEESYLDNNYWKVYNIETCYSLSEGLYGSKSFFEGEGYNIVSSSEIES